ncbi:uncharacterized protein LOC121418283 isoform X2 [Lytechinus variegatus]|uniref:uncharacterized protein LOC121418283 isoform X2 n=1 Tax=Lytechinus variegatus TaxID=7654 RepID=UPI001BB2AE1E|nr:uncharacterized protein LOC121418283 isoform X2 [Lytechinus variegatus]
MAGRKGTHWKPKAIFLLPNTFISNSYPNKETQNDLEHKGYGSCNIKEGLDRSWTIDQLAEELIAHYPQHKAELAKTGIEFAKLQRYSRKIIAHVLVKRSTVADLEKQHGQGILVILQKESVVPSQKVPEEMKGAVKVKEEVTSPKKSSNQRQKKIEPTSREFVDQVQRELDILSQLGGIKIAHLNCQSLCNKKDELKLLLLCRATVDVMTLSETWLGENDKNNSFNVPGYTIMSRKDRAYGGVLIYVKDSLSSLVRECDTKMEEGLDACCIDIQLGGSNDVKKGSDEINMCLKKTLLRIISVYVPPRTRDQVSLLKKLQRSLNKLKATESCKPTSSEGTGNKKYSCCCKTNYVILGDFNCDRKTLSSCKVMKSVNREKLQALDELEKDHHLSQLIKVHTRVGFRKTKCLTTKSLIDFVFTDNPDAVSSSGVAHIAMSDHYMVYCAYEPDKKYLHKSTPLLTIEEFSQLSKSDIDEEVYGMIRDRDRAKEMEDWNRYDLLKKYIKVAKNENKKARNKQKKALKLK